MTAINFYQKKSNSIIIGLILGLIGLLILLGAIVFIIDTYLNINTFKDLLFSIFIYSMFLLPALFLIFVAFNFLTRKILVCAIHERQLVISNYENRYGARSNKVIALKEIKEVDIIKNTFLRSHNLVIKLKNDQLVKNLTLNVDLSNQDKLKLKKEIDTIIHY